LPELEAAAAGNGFLSTVSDADGIVRRAPMVAIYRGTLSLACRSRRCGSRAWQARPTCSPATAAARRRPRPARRSRCGSTARDPGHRTRRDVGALSRGRRARHASRRGRSSTAR
jgi:hypothetical protein